MAPNSVLDLEVKNAASIRIYCLPTNRKPNQNSAIPITSSAQPPTLQLPNWTQGIGLVLSLKLVMPVSTNKPMNKSKKRFERLPLQRQYLPKIQIKSKPKFKSGSRKGMNERGASYSAYPNTKTYVVRNQRRGRDGRPKSKHGRL